MAVTHKGQHIVTVKEANGKVFLAFELLDGKEIPVLLNSNIGLFLNDNTSYKEAQNIANTINSKLEGLFITEL